MNLLARLLAKRAAKPLSVEDMEANIRQAAAAPKPEPKPNLDNPTADSGAPAREVFGPYKPLGTMLGKGRDISMPINAVMPYMKNNGVNQLDQRIFGVQIMPKLEELAAQGNGKVKISQIFNTISDFESTPEGNRALYGLVDPNNPIAKGFTENYRKRFSGEHAVERLEASLKPKNKFEAFKRRIEDSLLRAQIPGGKALAENMQTHVIHINLGEAFRGSHFGADNLGHYVFSDEQTKEGLVRHFIEFQTPQTQKFLDSFKDIKIENKPSVSYLDNFITEATDEFVVRYLKGHPKADGLARKTHEIVTSTIKEMSEQQLKALIDGQFAKGPASKWVTETRAMREPYHEKYPIHGWPDAKYQSFINKLVMDGIYLTRPEMRKFYSDFHTQAAVHGVDYRRTRLAQLPKIKRVEDALMAKAVVRAYNNGAKSVMFHLTEDKRFTTRNSFIQNRINTEWPGMIKRLAKQIGAKVEVIPSVKDSNKPGYIRLVFAPGAAFTVTAGAEELKADRAHQMGASLGYDEADVDEILNLIGEPND